MQFFEMLRCAPENKEALVLNGVSYTYGELVLLALQKKEEILAAKKDRNQKDKLWQRKVYIIKSEYILEQLICFFACNAMGYIPLIAPADSPLGVEEISKLAQQAFSSLEKKAEVCMAVMTSGTTGVPKIYFRTYESWAGFFETQNAIFHITEKSRLFTQGSLAFTGNLNLYLAQFYAKATIIAQERFWPKEWDSIMRKHKADSIYLIPSKLLLLPKVCKEPNEKIEMILSGSQSLGCEDAKKMQKIFPNTQILLYYGASELNYITYVTKENMTSERNLIGKPFPGVNVWIEQEALYIDTPYHVEGITTPYTLQDTGRQDENGNFYFLGRKDDILNIRGRKVSALKIENAFSQIEEVQEVAVTEGMHRGEKVIEAYVVAKKGFLERYRQKWHNELKKNLAAYEMPHNIYQVDRLPKNASGKVVKEKIAKERGYPAYES